MTNRFVFGAIVTLMLGIGCGDDDGPVGDAGIDASDDSGAGSGGTSGGGTGGGGAGGTSGSSGGGAGGEGGESGAGGGGAAGDSGSGGGGAGGGDAPRYSVGGEVSGLTGAGLVLLLNDGNDLTVSQNGAYTFIQELESGANYAVTIDVQPSNPTQTCTVANGTGTIG